MKIFAILFLSLFLHNSAEARFLHCDNSGKQQNAPAINIEGVLEGTTVVEVSSRIHGSVSLKNLASITPEHREPQAGTQGSIAFDVGWPGAWGNQELFIPATALEQARPVSFDTLLIDWSVDGDWYGQLNYALGCTISGTGN